MKYTVNVSAPISKSFRASSIAGKYDLDIKKGNTFMLQADLPTDQNDWQVGLICGPSGSGKSLLARQAFPEKSIVTGFEWKESSMVDDFPKELSVDEITGALSAVGLSSVPSWMLPYCALSNGQKFRADLARALASSEYVVYDEFTSVVDRDVARTAAYAVSKAVRRKPEQKFVAVSCHSDIIEWLEPDWVFDTLTGELRRGHLRRPSYKLRIYAGTYRNYPLFARNHYIGRPIPKHATVYLGVIDIEGSRRLVGIDSYMPCAGHKGVYQGGQCIVLPDFQGLGIGMRFIDACAELTHQRRGGIRIRSSIGSAIVNRVRAKREKLPGAAWKLAITGHRNGPDRGALKGKSSARAQNRLVVTWEYVPEAKRVPCA